MEQGSPEWFAARVGKVTASRVSDIVARTKSGYAASRANYMAELLCERLTGERGPTFQTSAMAWGTTNEPVARQLFVEKFGMPVEEVRFVAHADRIEDPRARRVEALSAERRTLAPKGARRDASRRHA